MLMVGLTAAPAKMRRIGLGIGERLKAYGSRNLIALSYPLP